MPKAIISDNIYIKIPSNPDIAKSILTALTYKIKQKSHNPGFSKIEIIKTYKLVNPDVLVIPQGREDLIPEGYEIEDRRILHDVPFPTPLLKAREDQAAIINKVTGSCFINAKVGWGKTFTALLLAAKLGQKTLVVTHNTFLRNQWLSEAERLFGMPVGQIGSGKFDIEDHFIVVGNIQTLSKHKDKIAKEFGTIIMDEAHHTPASTFTDIINSSHARYRIALSGTMERLDGKHVLFTDIFGPTVYKPPKNNTVDPVIHLVKTGLQLPGDGDDWASRMNLLLYDPTYQQLVANIARTYAAQGHRVLITADRVEFLEQIGQILGPRCAVVSGKSEEDRGSVMDKVGTEFDYVAGTRSIFSEGISVNILSCLILAQPSGNIINLEQLAGRIQRLHPDKTLKPVIADIQFKGGTAYRQAKDRLGFYLKEGFEVITL